MSYKTGLPPVPARLLGRPIDPRGYPIPWFVYFDEAGKPDFRVIRPGGLAQAISQNRCWICGGQMGVYKTFVLGPLSAVQKITSEPPSHRDCAQFAIEACPFIVNPRMSRSPRATPDGTANIVENYVLENPGIYCLWTAKSFSTFEAPHMTASGEGVLIKLKSQPAELDWFKAGRQATVEELEAGFAEGWPKLMAATKPEQHAELFRSKLWLIGQHTYKLGAKK